MTIAQLKALTIGMGVLIVLGVAGLAAVIAQRAAGAGALRPAVVVAVPHGARVVETALDGDRLALRLETPDGPRVTVVDLKTGEALSTVELAPRETP